MIIDVKVIPRSKKTNVKQEPDRLKVYLTAPAIEGKANSLLIEVLADFFKVKKSAVSIIKGNKSREKVVSVDSI